MSLSLKNAVRYLTGPTNPLYVFVKKWIKYFIHLNQYTYKAVFHSPSFFEEQIIEYHRENDNFLVRTAIIISIIMSLTDYFIGAGIFNSYASTFNLPEIPFIEGFITTLFIFIQCITLGSMLGALESYGIVALGFKKFQMKDYIYFRMVTAFNSFIVFILLLFFLVSCNLILWFVFSYPIQQTVITGICAIASVMVLFIPAWRVAQYQTQSVFSLVPVIIAQILVVGFIYYQFSR